MNRSTAIAGILLILVVLIFSIVATTGVMLASSLKLPSKSRLPVKGRVKPQAHDAELTLSALTQLLERREQRMGSMRYRWQIHTLEQTPTKTPEEILKEQNAIRSQVPDQLRKQGAKDDLIGTVVEQEVRHAEVVGKGSSQNSTHSWDFLRADDKTLVLGTAEKGTYQGAFAQYYSGRNGLLIHLHSSSMGRTQQPVEPPQIWGTDGDSIRYREPFQTGCNLWPEHFVFLAGFNPVALYGARWRLTSATAQSYILETQIKEGDLPDSAVIDKVRLTLSRRLGSAPAHINVTRQLETQVIETLTLQGLNYQRQGVDWICNDLVVRDVIPGILTREQNWKLETVAFLGRMPSLTIGHEQVSDYRLVSLNMTTDDYLLTLSTPGSKSVTYQWSGYFPSLGELEQMRKP